MTVDDALRAVPLGCLSMRPGPHQRRFDLNHAYLSSLRTDNLVRNHLFEAGLWAPPHRPGDDIHWGWESPNSMVRGHVVGHWMAAAAKACALTGDEVLAAKVRLVVKELGRCQEANGGEWVAAIPEKYLHWIAEGRMIWAPHYVAQKVLMGLLEVHRITGDEQALSMVVKAARWFARWLSPMTRRELDDLFDFETGGMLELWANLYSTTGDEQHLELMRRYDRPRLFEPLLAGEDILTNEHANMTIPEVQGAARAWEVTGEQRWRDIVEAYWACAVDARSAWCTGGQTSAELWTPPGVLSSRLGDTDQEHCTVFNMRRLAGYLYRWTGEHRFADYAERVTWNGIMAQQHPQTGMVTYYLPLRSGGRKKWSTPTESFWCCVGSLLQAHADVLDDVYHQAGDGGLVVSQRIGSEVRVPWCDGVTFRQAFANEPPPDRADYARTEPLRRPQAQTVEMAVACERACELDIRVRLPWWLCGPATARVGDADLELGSQPGRLVSLGRRWEAGETALHLELPRRVVAEPLPDAPDTFALLDGPVVLAGLVDAERTLVGDPADPATMLRPHDERALELNWKDGTYRSRGVDPGFVLVPLWTVADDAYQVYFPVALPPAG